MCDDFNPKSRGQRRWVAHRAHVGRPHTSRMLQRLHATVDAADKPWKLRNVAMQIVSMIGYHGKERKCDFTKSTDTENRILKAMLHAVLAVMQVTHTRLRSEQRKQSKPPHQTFCNNKFVDVDDDVDNNDNVEDDEEECVSNNNNNNLYFRLDEAGEPVDDGILFFIDDDGEIMYVDIDELLFGSAFNPTLTPHPLSQRNAAHHGAPQHAV